MINQESVYLIVNANDSIAVSWTNGSSAQETILGIRCWDRTTYPLLCKLVQHIQETLPLARRLSNNPLWPLGGCRGLCLAHCADKGPVSDTDGFNPPSLTSNITTTKDLSYTVLMKPYVHYDACRFLLYNSIPDQYEEESDRVFISNATDQGGQTWSREHQAPLNATAPGIKKKSTAGMMGVSMMSLCVGLFVSTIVIAP